MQTLTLTFLLAHTYIFVTNVTIPKRAGAGAVLPRRSSGAKGRNLSLGFKASEKSEGTLPVQCDRSEAIARSSTMRFGCQGREIDDFGNYLGGQMTPFRAATPVVTAIENYALFI